MLTFEEIDRMPSAEYRQKLNDPAFAAEVEALFAAPQAAAPAISAPAPTPDASAIDPSMPDRPTTNGRPSSTSVRERIERPSAAPEVPPVVEATPILAPPAPAPAPVAEVERTYEYQPVDEFSRPIGGKQVIKYRSETELAEKMAKNHEQAIRQLRKVTREARLGQNQESIPNEAARFEPVEFKEKPLTAEERFQLTQDLNDPEKFAAARDRLLESAVGASPAKLRETLNDQNMKIAQMAAKENFLTFAEHSTFITGHQPTDEENARTLTDWMFKNRLAPTVENFKLADSQLRSAGLLNEAPVVQQVPVPQAPPVAAAPVVPVESVVPKAQEPVVVESRITPAQPVQPKRQSPVPSGLNDRVSSASGQSPVTAPSVTLADIDRMSADEYKKAARNPAFVALVNRLENEAALRRRQRAGQV